MPTLVEIVPYDAAWPRHFEGCAAELRLLLGPCVIAVDHVGSTAVPGLSAKPLLDIGVTLRGGHDISAACATLVAAGYESRGNRYGDGMWAFLHGTAVPPRRVYVFAAGNEAHARRITFRDYLRIHDEAARDYERLKMRLAASHPYDGDRYTAAKGAFIADTVRRARAAADE